MSVTVQLPVGPAPDWELDEAGDEREGSVSQPEVHSLSESLVVYQSLRQSRNAWLTSIFPKFSSKQKGKLSSDSAQLPPHSIRPVGKCDLEIGPHTFYETSFFEVNYTTDHPPAPYSTNVETYQYGPGSSSFTGSYGSTSTSYSLATRPLSMSLQPGQVVTPNLISQVNAAASSNPIVQNLLQAAAHGTANVEQLQTLAAFIQTLASQPTAPYPTASYDSSATESSILAETQKLDERPPDLVVEFKENPTDRLLISRDIEYGEKAPLSSPFMGRFDISIGILVPFGDGSKSNVSKRPAVLELRRAPTFLTETIWKWMSEDSRSPEAKVAFNEKVEGGVQRAYLQHHLPDGNVLQQLRLASTAYPMRSIKSSAGSHAATKPKRPARRRKSNTTGDEQIIVGRSKAVDSPVTKSPNKRRKSSTQSSQPKGLPAFACSSCGQTDVPLMQGGRYCRSCLDGLPPQSPAAPVTVPITKGFQPNPDVVVSTTGRMDTVKGFVHHTPTLQQSNRQQNLEPQAAISADFIVAVPGHSP